MPFVRSLSIRFYSSESRTFTVTFTLCLFFLILSDFFLVPLLQCWQCSVVDVCTNLYCGHCCWVSVFRQWWFRVRRVGWFQGGWGGTDELMPSCVGLLELSITKHKRSFCVLVLCSPYSRPPGSDRARGCMQVLVCVCVQCESNCGQFSVLMHYLWGKKHSSMHPQKKQTMHCFFVIFFLLSETKLLTFLSPFKCYVSVDILMKFTIETDCALRQSGMPTCFLHTMQHTAGRVISAICRWTQIILFCSLKSAPLGSQ